MLKGKAMIVLLAVGLDLSNYATKDLKNAVGVDTSGFVEGGREQKNHPLSKTR